MELGPILRAMRRNKIRFGLIVARDRADPGHRRQLRDHDPATRAAKMAQPSGFDDDEHRRA